MNDKKSPGQRTYVSFWPSFRFISRFVPSNFSLELRQTLTSLLSYNTLIFVRTFSKYKNYRQKQRQCVYQSWCARNAASDLNRINQFHAKSEQLHHTHMCHALGITMRYLNTAKTIVRRRRGKILFFFWKRNLTIKILAFAWANKSLLYGNGRDHHICASTVQMFAGVECVRASVTTPRWARNRTFSSPAPRCVGSDDCTSHAESHYSNLRTYKSTDSSKSHRDRSTMWIDIPHKSYNVVLCCVEASNE